MSNLIPVNNEFKAIVGRPHHPNQEQGTPASRLPPSADLAQVRHQYSCGAVFNQPKPETHHDDVPTAKTRGKRIQIWQFLEYCDAISQKPQKVNCSQTSSCCPTQELKCDAALIQGQAHVLDQGKQSSFPTKPDALESKFVFVGSQTKLALTCSNGKSAQT